LTSDGAYSTITPVAEPSTVRAHRASTAAGDADDDDDGFGGRASDDDDDANVVAEPLFLFLFLYVLFRSYELFTILPLVREV